jgi:hypothetical protein
MAKKIIKVRLFTHFEDVDSHVEPGATARVERISHYGDEVDITDKASLARGEEFDAFFSDEEAKGIRKGEYPAGHEGLLAQARGDQLPAATTGPADVADEGPQTGELSSTELGAYIVENKLNVDQTVALANESDVDDINRVLDAEDHAARLRGNDPRAGVVDRLEAKLTAASSSGNGNGDEGEQ